MIPLLSSLLQRLGLGGAGARRGIAPTPEVLGQLELLVHDGRIGDREAVSLLQQLAATHSNATVAETLSRLHCAGLRTPGFLALAADFSEALRDFDAAVRYATSLRHDLRLGGGALLRLAVLAHHRGQYGTTISTLNELLQEGGASEDVHWFLGLSHLRQGASRSALEQLQQTRRLSSRDTHWLTSLARNGPRRGPKDWYGRRHAALERELVRGWRESVLNAPLRVRTQSLRDVDVWINGCRYVSDPRLFGRPDHWQTPDALERNGLGDCEDFALWAWVQLLRQGADARFVIGGMYDDDVNHAWVHVHRGGRVLVFECTPLGVNVAIDARCATEYQPILSVDRSLAVMVHVPDWREAWFAD